MIVDREGRELDNEIDVWILSLSPSVTKTTDFPLKSVYA
jgi:hypothetical protein